MLTYWLGWGGVIEPEAKTMGDANLIHTVQLQALTGTFIMAPIALLAAAHVLRPSSRAQPDEIDAWLEEFPNAKLKA